MHKDLIVCAEKSSKRVHLVAKEHSEDIRIVAWGCATGAINPPNKGKRMKEWVDNLPVGSACQMKPKGSMAAQTFVKLISHFSKFKPQGSRLLIFDGIKSHLAYSVMDETEKNVIRLLCLPSNNNR